MTKGILLCAAAAAVVFQPGTAEAKKKRQPAPVPAAAVQLPYQSANLPTSGQVRAFYAGWRYAPIGFKGNAIKPAANELVTILRRAPLDGVAAGPQYAAQVQSAINQAMATPTPQAIAYAEHTLSEALVLYAQVMQRPVQGLIYGYDYMKPKPATADKVLRLASGSPSLEQYLQQVTTPNPIYASIRNAAWQEMQATGAMAPDPRVVANLDRARPMPARGKFALVDVATQRLFLYENGVPVDSMKVVVGKKDYPTPMIASTIFYTVYTPYWNAPDHLVRQAIAPNVLRQGIKYLKSRGYEVMADWTTDAAVVDPTTVDWKAVAAGKVQIRIRQKPSEENFMGDLKFPFANPEDIFLHDTPQKEYFNKASRDLSNGCIRVEDARRFGRWLLGRDPVKPNDQPEQFEQLPQGVPVYVTYLTAQPQNGQLTFVDDIYDWDPSVGSGTQVAAGN